ncbi:hypothetical protein DPMN_106119 [Dreissena polymorpha]|uniref:Uncharacterized protein n=1 Tax=Dreissena polymorpha TaxID=45954 RepID=A0A9D4K4E4_DREPO|nr:hypothetical protein DPMN_106119 [Dreissena polymorpha]
MAECPLVVILDSLDQLDTSHNGRSLMWLPVHLPPHCKIIVSSLPEEKYEAFPALKVSERSKRQQVYSYKDKIQCKGEFLSIIVSYEGLHTNLH